MAIVDIYREIVRIREAGERAALATIVRRLGSTPRKDSAKMLIREDGTALGSVGGGCVAPPRRTGEQYAFVVAPCSASVSTPSRRPGA